MPANGFFKATSVSECRFDFRLRAIWISVSKNRSSLPANGLFGRRAPFAAVWMQPNESVHHETIRLVSLSFRFRRRMAVVVSIVPSYPPFLFRPPHPGGSGAPPREAYLISGF